MLTNWCRTWTCGACKVAYLGLQGDPTSKWVCGAHSGSRRHAISCPKLHGTASSRHKLLQQLVRRVAYAGGMSSCIEPMEKHLKGRQPEDAGNRKTGYFFCRRHADCAAGRPDSLRPVMHPPGRSTGADRQGGAAADTGALDKDKKGATIRMKHLATLLGLALPRNTAGWASHSRSCLA